MDLQWKVLKLSMNADTRQTCTTPAPVQREFPQWRVVAIASCYAVTQPIEDREQNGRRKSRKVVLAKVGKPSVGQGRCVEQLALGSNPSSQSIERSCVACLTQSGLLVF